MVNDIWTRFQILTIIRAYDGSSLLTEFLKSLTGSMGVLESLWRHSNSQRVTSVKAGSRVIRITGRIRTPAARFPQPLPGPRVPTLQPALRLSTHGVDERSISFCFRRAALLPALDLPPGLALLPVAPPAPGVPAGAARWFGQSIEACAHPVSCGFLVRRSPFSRQSMAGRVASR